MASSPSGSINLHDYRRIGELFLQALVAFVLTWVIDIIPAIDFGKYSPVAAIALLVLTELVKRYKQAPTE